MKKIGLIYSFNAKKSATIAKQIKKELSDVEVEEINAEEITGKHFLANDNLILGVPTWFDGELPNYWDEFVPELEDLNLKEKKIAIYGLGDQAGYPENFVDAVGIMARLVVSRGAEIAGKTSTEGYSYESSAAVEENKFLGLALDQENQARETKSRIKDWVGQLKKEFK
jgi:flavodoxin I